MRRSCVPVYDDLAHVGGVIFDGYACDVDLLQVDDVVALLYDRRPVHIIRASAACTKMCTDSDK